VIDLAAARGFEAKVAIVDKGYDQGPSVKHGEDKPPTCEHGTWTFAGADYKRKATKWRARQASASPRHAG
jgi:hypothetical protein